MEQVKISIRSNIGDSPVHYQVKTSKEIAEKYIQVKKENPGIDQMKALKLASNEFK